MSIQDQIKSFTEAATAGGWEISVGAPRSVALPDSIVARYPRIPEECQVFLACVRRCISGRAIFFCVEDYKNTDADRCHWNDLEQMSLEAAENDEALADEIRHFWGTQFPIAFGPQFSYLSLSVSPNDFGAVFYGFKHYWEEPERVAGSFCEYLSRMTGFLTGNEDLNYKNEDGDDCAILAFADFI